MTQFGNSPYEPFGGPHPGPPAYGGPPQLAPPQESTNTCATLSVVFAILFAPAGAVLGHVALAQIKRTGQRGRDRAIIGLVVSYVLIVITVVGLVIWSTLPDKPSDNVRPSPTATRPVPTTTPVPVTLPDAQTLLLASNSETPAGSVTAMPIDDNYFTSTDPPDCAGALLLKNSPLPPTGAQSHAESAYRIEGQNDNLLAESVNVYRQPLDPGAVLNAAMVTVSQCTASASGINSLGRLEQMRLTNFAIGDNVLVWTMSRPEWTCNYGFTLTTHASLLISLCEDSPTFPMHDWAVQRHQEIAQATGL